jgi:Leucine-rich repeat (LRR) protein
MKPFKAPLPDFSSAAVRPLRTIHGGSLTELPDEIVAAKPWLKSLSLAFNPVTKIPDILWELTNLEELTLLGTDLGDIPDDIARLPNLRRLDIS